MSQSTPKDTREKTITRLHAAVRKDSLAAVARRINIPRSALANVLIGIAREGTTLQVVEAARAAQL